jgi:hypothetical protein
MVRYTQSAIVLAALLLAALGPTLASARKATPEAENIPARNAPFGLGTVTLPEDRGAIVALFKTVMTSGHETRFANITVEDDRIVLTVANSEAGPSPALTLQAVDLSASDFFPADFTAADYVRLAARAEDVGTVAYGRDGTIVWTQAESTAGVAGDNMATPTITRPVYTLAWGYADSPWIFTVSAEDETALADLATAFVAVAGRNSATPSPVVSPSP